MDGSINIAITAAIAIGACALLAVGGCMAMLFMLLRHREKMRKMQADNADESERLRVLEKKFKELEARSAMLEERVADAHVLIAGEQRTLDSKLNALLPPMPADTESNTTSKERSENRERQKV